jgi:two-component system, NtrC family, sensor histidine kinase HydH
LRLPLNIKPVYVAWIAAAVALLVAASGFIELRQSREEIYHVMREEALSLSEAVVQSGINNLLSSDEIESLLTERLLNNAAFIARLDSAGHLSSRELESIAAANGLFRINIFDRRGRKVLSSHTRIDEHAGREGNFSPADILRPILDGTRDHLVIGLRDARFEQGERYAVAVRRTRPGGGAIVVNLDANELLEFRKKIGIGKLLHDLGDNSGVAYVVLQDRQGIIAASGAVEELSSFDADTLLSRVETADTVIARVVPFRDSDVFEVVRQFDSESTPGAVCRLGLAMDEVRATESRMMRRIILSSILIIAIGVLAVTVIIGNQNFRVVERNYRSIQTFTGNILSQMQDAVVTVDASGTVTLFNSQAERLFGLSAEAVLGKTVDAGAPDALRCISELLSSREAHSEQSIACGGLVGRKIVAVTLSKTLTPGGETESTTAVIRDLTQSRLLEQEVQRKDRLSAMGELASGVAHEIRNPLNAISMIAQRFEKEFSPRKNAQEYRALTGVLRSEVQRVNGIIHQFLRFARPPALDLQPVSIGPFLEEVGLLFAGQAEAKGVRFVRQNTCDRVTLIDRDQLSQALLNLLQNALDATEQGEKIELSCADEEGGTVAISVSDTGRGIPSEQMAKVFNLYYTTKPEGTGIGLPIVQQVVTQHQGSLQVESQPGKGSTFVIRLRRS